MVRFGRKGHHNVDVCQTLQSQQQNAGRHGFSIASGGASCKSCTNIELLHQNVRVEAPTSAMVTVNVGADIQGCNIQVAGEVIHQLFLMTFVSRTSSH